MKLSARNVVSGTIVGIKTGATTAHVMVEISPGVVVTSAITNDAVAALGLATGKAAYVVVKASDVMIGVD